LPAKHISLRHRRACPTVFASKPAPTDLRTTQISGIAWVDCRSALAREKYQPATSPSLTHRVRQQAGSYRFEYDADFEGCLGPL
jgi:hypothetical protein